MAGEIEVVKFGNCYFGEKSGILVEKVKPMASVLGSDKHLDFKNADDVFDYERSNLEVSEWGSDNMFPNNVAKIVIENAVVPGLLNWKAIMAVAQGMYFYKERQDGDEVKKIPVIDNELSDYFEELEIQDYLRASAIDVEYFRNSFTELIRSRNMKRINRINRLDVTNCRLSAKQNHVFAYDTWNDIDSHKYLAKIPLFDKDALDPQFIVHAKNFFPGATSYGTAPWIGSLNWTRMNTEVAKFKLRAIRNGFSIKYHIKMPADYFLKNFPDSRIKLLENNPDMSKEECEAYRVEEEKKMIARMNDYLSGNGHQTFFSKFGLMRDGKPLPGWEIIPIEDKVEYEAFLADVETSLGMIVSAHGVHPATANILVPGKLSTGSDQKHAFNIFMQVMTSEPRELFLKAPKMAKRITFPNKRDIHIGIKNIELTTTDLVKKGFAEDATPQAA